jgi:hypothetical protein
MISFHWRPLTAAVLALGLLAVPAQGYGATLQWKTSVSSGDWTDGRNWSGSALPGKNDKALIKNGVDVTLDETVTIGHLRIESPAKLYLDGSGVLEIEGLPSGAIDVFGNPKISTMAIREGSRVEFGPNVTVRVLGSRFGVNGSNTPGNGGQLIINSSKVRFEGTAATTEDNKLQIAAEAVIRVNTPHWEPNMGLTMSQSHWHGPHKLEFGLSADVAQGITLQSVVQHSVSAADTFLIQGFEQGDFLRFNNDPTQPSLPPEYGSHFQLRMEQTVFEGWGNGGAAELEQIGDYWYLKPEGTSVPMHGDMNSQ